MAISTCGQTNQVSYAVINSECYMSASDSSHNLSLYEEFLIDLIQKQLQVDFHQVIAD